MGLLCLVLPGSLRADNFTFSFTNTDGTLSGTVTGEIFGLTNNAASAATEVLITSYPPLFNGDPDLAQPNTTIAPWTVQSNSFTEVAGGLIAYNYASEGPGDNTVFGLDSAIINKTADDLGGLATDYTAVGGLGPEEDVLSSTVTFTPAASTPEPSSLLLLGAGLLGLMLSTLRWKRRAKQF